MVDGFVMGCLRSLLPFWRINENIGLRMVLVRLPDNLRTG
ncbi:hypothetical protein PRUB_a0967 [Pseudoalteromonas rubra]|uniref:Uncharacterized protein n=1 Tax=Pseudoalteromonas rubra TaxID=43658 RepID=A0A8T0C7P0_9GAMM|nr:hypothetical protein PRUB_a0967 [Pseudoalteromonas rubra]